MSTPDDTNLIGYWQSEKYFLEISNLIKSEFTFPYEISIKNKETLRDIKKKTAISIHIRHGDYLTNPTTRAYHGICSLDYYKNAIKKIEEKVTDPEYFIFTDDPEWAKENIFTIRPRYVIDWNGNEPHEDLRLMASCKHHIIANSSFSWWGAWLGKHENQMVIAPEPWFDTIIHDTKDIYCPSWTLLSKN
jgi:hypothetical protein